MARTQSDFLRPSDADAVRAELRDGHRATGLPVLFGGVVDGTDLLLSGFVGTRTAILRNLTICAECGLGGRAISERRPGAVADYANSAEITHEYDVEVAAEGVESLTAAPAVVNGRTRAVIYGGLRSAETIGDSVITRLVLSARRLAREIEVRDEVDRRVQLISNARSEYPPARFAPGADTGSTATLPTVVADGIVESYVALREIAASTDDPVLAAQLHDIEVRLRTLGSSASSSTDVPTLSARESDVLAYLALGCSNAEIAGRLGLRGETVKSYVRNLMAKLDVHNRHEAVVVGRRLGLLP